VVLFRTWSMDVLITISAVMCNLSEARQANKNYVFWLALILCTIYLSYRYPPQVNTVGFSPTYSDRLLVRQAENFILAFRSSEGHR
jgi:hypothetical protein